MDVLHRALLRASFHQTLLVDADGRVLEANDAACRRLGIPRDSLLDRDVFSLFPEPVARDRRRHLREAIDSGQTMTFEDVSQSGTPFECRIHPVADGAGADMAVVAVRDAPQDLRAEESRYRLACAIEQAAEAVIILDEDMVVEYVNQAFEAMTGYAQKEIKGRSIEVLYQGEDQAGVLGNIMGCLAHGDKWAGRTNNTRKDGSVFSCEQTIGRIRGKRYLPLGFVSIWRDVTEMRALERQLRQAQKMEAIATLAGGIAHDFNNILGPIIIHAELGLARAGPDDPNRESLGEILDAANRARGLVNHILGLSRERERDAPLPFRLGQSVKECLRIIRPGLPSSIAISFANEAADDTVVADPTQIHQVVMNLCTNAAQAMGETGSLDLRLDRVEVGEDRSPGEAELPPGSYLRLRVADTGRGIAPEHLERVFDPFFTTKRAGVGTGLGLTVMRGIVSSMGGEVRLSSEVGRGTVFDVYLPRPAAPVRPLEPPPRESGEAPGRPGVLLVCGDEVSARGVASALEQLGYAARVCGNGYEALARFRQDPDAVELAMVDVATPEMRAMELVRELRLTRPDLPVVVLSSFTEVFPPDRAEATGVRAFLRTPCCLDELEGVLRRAAPLRTTEEA
ncbi:hybrid sensor histidine kinase/response regulator [Desulfohalovibrio reitneri]|uniref:hybrid sensor histidine kinase/response regulator n=1 Tax=Desulfohalovibrio reitneri TaxID=1307759 RepID=UPI00068AF259|nr:PAS domain S-box protein [Desulfohalovibrio reitneri]